MLAFSTIVSAAVAFTSIGVYATPAARSTCSPNVQGSPAGIVLVDSGVQWGDVNTTPASGDVLTAVSFLGLPVPEPNFFVSQSGQFPTSFVITNAVSNNELTVTSINNQLVFEPTSSAGGQENQLFDIFCQTCSATPSPAPLGQPAGESCTVSPQSNSSNCVEVDGSSLVITQCDGSNAQLFNIVL
ncbi:hypothetical protein BT96DRAFT_917745 [Gymnopus androsaceus JB14]|uniref:Ricin B lectin domain-containing protein n=1 Tax=Gymnopus androsaceus JB14 TaxID=1447944 RepID=A0A6A4I1M6_9AGAR|nr:hypothetical protein BT96DRAFT_917745 [Gymnopus androsaceus JB14]